MVSHRSTKGASKARRDHINHEIRNMRALLPISQEDQERLSYLHSMAAICTYIRKSVLFQGESRSRSSSPVLGIIFKQNGTKFAAPWGGNLRMKAMTTKLSSSLCNQSSKLLSFLLKGSRLERAHAASCRTRRFFKPCTASSWSPPPRGGWSMCLKT